MKIKLIWNFQNYFYYLLETKIEINMIDRISFEIRKFDFEKLKMNLNFQQRSINEKTGEYNYTCKLNNLSVNLYSKKLLRITGSLHKFANGDNFSVFTYEEAKKALHKLSTSIDVPLENFIVTRIELGLNIRMKLDPMKYIETVRQYKKYRFIPMTPYTGTSKINGYRCKLSEYEIKLYDKTSEVILSKKIKVIDKDKIPKKILRFEISLSRKKLKDEGFNNVTGKSLLSSMHYIKFKRLFKKIFDDLYFFELPVQYLAENIGNSKDLVKYMFIMSENYKTYTDFLKECNNKDKYYNEFRASKILLNKIRMNSFNTLENELRKRFTLALSQI